MNDMLNRNRLIEALEPFSGYVQSAVLYNLIEHGVLEQIVVNGVPARKALESVITTPERVEALQLFLRTAGYTDNDRATDKLVQIWEARGWYQMMIGGYGRTFLDIGNGFADPAAVPRDGRMVGVGSCEISVHDAIPLMYRVLDQRGKSYRSGIDLGCGSGIFLTTLAEKYADMRLTGIEPSPEGAAAAVEFVAGSVHADRIDIVNADAIGHLEQTDAHYDFGIISFVIHEILGQEGENGVRKFLRTLFDNNPGIELLVIDIDYCWDDAEKMRDPHRTNYYNHYFLLHPFTDQRLAPKQYWADLYDSAGLEVVVDDVDTPGLDETGIVTAMLLRAKENRHD
ncbi:methyltransferase domain-containing protein [Nocardia sp. NPDC051756]|uniref:methyltransferase domain-containing protein n=1 Tax=Nocardia sp. NPDC051756 TaxID=3154751 RepID=UPI003437B8EE